VIVLVAAIAAAWNVEPRAQSDLDAFMQKVLASRDENWKKLQQYILDERERIEVRGPSRQPLFGQQNEYSWFIREGFFIRSPVKRDGVTVPEEERRKQEERYLTRARERDRKEREKKNAADQTGNAAGDPERPPLEAPTSLDALLTQSRQPEFVDSAYFLKFEFEGGKYALVGRETFDGRDVLRIEYYPTKLFRESEEDAARRKEREAKRGKPDPSREREWEEAMQRMMNKVSLVTLWVTADSHQIVKYTFDNVNMDFLPAAWLVRVNGLTATMTMGQPFKDVWLPRDVEFNVSLMFALGVVDVQYHLDYYDYREAKTSGRIKLPEPR
jgi:hypothetical protein